MSNKLLVRLIYVIAVATLILIVALGYIAVKTNGDTQYLKELIRKIENKPPSVQKIEGKNGYTPIKNVDYFDGKDGNDGKDAVSTHTEKTVIKEVPVEAKDGKDGTPGLTPEILVDPESCLLLTRYQGDEGWTVQAQLPKPCEVQ